MKLADSCPADGASATNWTVTPFSTFPAASVVPAELACSTMSLFGWPKRIYAEAFVPKRSPNDESGVIVGARLCPTIGPAPVPEVFRIPKSCAVLLPLTSRIVRLSPDGNAASG